MCWYYFYKKRILFYKVHLRCQRPFNLQVFHKKSAIKPAIEALLGLKASMNAWSASLFKRRRPLCLPLPLQTVRYVLRLRGKQPFLLCWEYTAAMTTHCTYKFPVNAFRVLNRVTFSARGPYSKEASSLYQPKLLLHLAFGHRL